MEYYRWHRVYFTKTKRERDSDYVECFPHNTPLPDKSSSENFIIAAHELAHALQNPAPQAPFSDIGDSQTVAIEQLSGIFSKLAANLHQIIDPQQQHTVTKSSTIPHKVRPNMTKPIPSEHPNLIEDDYGKIPTSFQHNVHMSPTHYSPRSHRPTTNGAACATSKVGHRKSEFQLEIKRQKNPIPNFSLTSQFQKVREANAVTHQIYGVT